MADQGIHYERLRGGDYCADAAELFKEGLDYASQSTRSRSRRSARAVAAADEVTIA